MTSRNASSTDPAPLPPELGYRWPAEWEPHEATWLSWPRPEGISFPDSYDRVMPTFVAMVRAIAASETVCINVRDAQDEKRIRGYFGKDVPAALRFFRIPTQEPWCRDHGPIFLTRDKQPDLCALDFGYNAWGGKYPPFDLDDVVPTRISKQLALPVSHPGFILEGGSIDGNGDGTLLTTESCLLNPNRNPHLDRAQIESLLSRWLGVKQVLWLGDGIEGDDTDGHVDDLTRFVSRSTVVTVVEEDRSDANHEPLQENLSRLRGMALYDGTPLEVIPLPMPAKIEREDLRLPASYANFYIANEAVLVPTFADRNDARALDTLQRCFSERRVVGIDCRELIWGLGAFHCLTQQMPRSARRIIA